ncbi:MAG TPA: class I SAM-dependent methyltransferase [Terriglobales bacterium]|nr:class I SAM-dependent methyltransferase [Terriglobales bacterium]
MPVLRVDNYCDAYRLRARAADIHELAARPNKKHVTEFVNRRILEILQVEPGDFLVDIGCGDAALLRMSAGRTAKSVGIVSTSEEKEKLDAAFPGLSITVADVGCIPLESAAANKIVCNAVLLYLPSEERVKAALREIARIARPGATILVGEIPEVDEYKHYGMYRGSSMLAYLWHLLTRNGLRSFLGMIRLWWKAVFGQQQIVLNSAGVFHMPHDRFVELATGCGLKLKSCFRHKELNQERAVVDSEFRYDYMFTV